MTSKFYEVGGSVRDKLLGIPSKDLDLICLGPRTFEEMEAALISQGAEIFVSKPEYYTIRCKLPKIGPCDVALARVDGSYSDGRRPDSVSLAGSVEQELSRRDFTCNAIAKDPDTNQLIDPFDGQKDIERKLLRCVGSATQRFTEDSLRLLRAIRFSITKGFDLDDSIVWCLRDDFFVRMLKNVSEERIFEEMGKCFQYNTLLTLVYLETYPKLRTQIFSGRLWLKPTMEKS